MSDEADELFERGERFHGYVIEKKLGKGGVGSVFLAKHEILDALFAVKVLLPGVAEQDAVQVKRFLREARLATHVRHPNLVAVHDCGFDETKNFYYLVMDYVSGGSLREALAFEGRFSVDRAAEIVVQVASALKAAQDFHLVHRDIKPENIMIQPDGRVKLVDFGIAKAQNLGDSLCTSTDNFFGTPSYVSPEQAECSANVDVRADIYSLGIVFFEMLTGKCPYTGSNAAQVLSQILSSDETPDVRDLVRDVPADVAVLIRRMTVKERTRRLSSLDAVLTELAKLGYREIQAQKESVGFGTPSSPGMKTLLEGLEAPTKANVDPLANPDDDVKAFLAARESRSHKSGLFASLTSAVSRIFSR